MTTFYEAVEFAQLLSLSANLSGIQANGNEIKNAKIWHLTNAEVSALTDADKGKILCNTNHPEGKTFGIRITGKTVYMNDLTEMVGIVPISNGGTGKSSVGLANQFLGVNATGNDLEYKTIEGTANQIITTNSAEKLTLSLPQSINTTATPVFSQISLNNEPTDSKHLVRKQDLEAVMLGMQPKDGCVCATTANITLSGFQTIDGYAVVAGDRVLVKNQTTTSQNGVYVANSGAWSRATDLDVWKEFYCAYVFVDYGTANGDTGWRCTVGTTGIMNTDPITFVKFTSIGQILVDGASALTKTNNNLAVNVDNTTIEINGSNQLRVKSGNRFKTYSQNLPSTAANTAIVITHSLGTIPTLIAYRTIATRSPIFPNITGVTSSTITCQFPIAVPASTFEVICGVVV